jgi:hypothetical protein
MAAFLALQLLSPAGVGPRSFTVDALAIPARAGLLPLEVLRQAFVPHSALVPWRWLRFGLAIVFLAPALLLRTARPPSPALSTLATGRAGLALLLAFAAPYLLRPTGLHWPSRYLYFPSAALLLLVALALSRTRPAALALTLAWAAVVGLLSGEVAAARIRDRHMLALSVPAAEQVVRAVSDRLAGRPQAPLVLEDAQACAFLAGVQTPERLACSTSAPR